MAIHDVPQAVAGSRHEAIAAAITRELQRQASGAAKRIDIEAMATAIEMAIAEGEPFPLTMDNGRDPDELNASNDV